MIPSEDSLLTELEAAPTLWSAADTAEHLGRVSSNPLYSIIERVLRRFALTTWPKKPRDTRRRIPMFQVRLVIYPVGGGEEQYSLDMMVPALPRQGDYLTVLRSGTPQDERHSGSEDFWVRRVAWMFDYPDDGKTHSREGEGPVGRATHIYVECEYAVTVYSSQSHRDNAGPDARHFGPSAD